MTIFLEHYHDGNASVWGTGIGNDPEFKIVQLQTSTPGELLELKNQIEKTNEDEEVLVGYGVIRKTPTKKDAIRLIERAMANDLYLYID